jgi:hypothetical protein
LEHAPKTAGAAIAAALSARNERRVKPELLTIRGPFAQDSGVDRWVGAEPTFSISAGGTKVASADVERVFGTDRNFRYSRTVSHRPISGQRILTVSLTGLAEGASVRAVRRSAR